MYRRKIQLVAGTTYVISLPKDWVRKNKLKEQNELVLTEKNNRTLVVSPDVVAHKSLTDYTVNVDEYASSIEEVIYGLYYLGVENINLISKKEISKEIKARIRKVVTYMIGTEISYEDKSKITLSVLIDKSKVNIKQLLYRMGLIIDLSIENILGEMDIEEIHVNEDEIDRLYQLTNKIVSLSLVNSNVLASSHIVNVSLIPIYSLIAKKLENFMDTLRYIGDYLQRKKINLTEGKDKLTIVKEELSRTMSFLASETSTKSFERHDRLKIKVIRNQCREFKDETLGDFIGDLFRYLIDIQEEAVHVSFYSRLIREGVV